MSDQGSADGADAEPSGWQVPGDESVAGDPEPLRFGQSPAFGGSAAPGSFPNPPLPGSPLPGSSPFAPPPPTWAPHPGGGPDRPEPKRTPPTVVALIVLVAVVVIGLGAWFTRWIDGRDDTAGNFTYYDDSSMTTIVGGSPAPAVVVPPADAAASTTAIVDLYVKVFTPGQSDELWDSLISDPGNLREQIRPFGRSDCAVGVETVVTSVQFTGDDSADVRFRFQGPNIPEFGTSYEFTGGAVRQPDGSWKATPEGVQEVASLASGYCG